MGKIGDELGELLAEAANASVGPHYVELWERAVSRAEEEGDEAALVVAYAGVCDAYANGGRLLHAITPFARLLNERASRPYLFDADLDRVLVVLYSRIVEAMRLMPTVPFDQCLFMAERLRAFCLDTGASLLGYHAVSYALCRECGDRDGMERNLTELLGCEIDPRVHCPHAVAEFRIVDCARREMWGEACQIGDLFLANPRCGCANGTDQISTSLLMPWLAVGRGERAWRAHLRAYETMARTGPLMSHYLPSHIDYLVARGLRGHPESLRRAEGILARHLSWWVRAETPRLLAEHAVSAYRLVRALGAEDPDGTLHATLPGEDLPWLARPGLANPDLDEAKAWLSRLALDVAAWYDARPGLERPVHVERTARRLSEPPWPGAELSS